MVSQIKLADHIVLLSGYNPLNTGITSSFSVLELASGTEYFYRLKAQNTGGTTTYSHIVSTWTVPLSPVTISASNITETAFFANWKFSHGATNYFLDVSATNTFSNFIIGNLRVGTATTWLVDGLDNNDIYYYRVRASNAGGTGADSDTMGVILVPEPTLFWILNFGFWIYWRKLIPIAPSAS